MAPSSWDFPRFRRARQVGDRADEKRRSTCSYCGVGCGIRAWTDRRGRLQVEGDPDHPVNRGALCAKGQTLHYAMRDHSDRLLYPEMRATRSDPTARVSWEGAMRRAASEFRSSIDRYGPDSVGFYVSGQCLTEEYYVANKLVKGFIGTNNIDTNSRLCMSSAAAAHTAVFGEDAVPTCYSDIEHADCFLIAGANPAWCHPILFQRIEARRASAAGIRVIVADPRRTASCESADLHLALLPGTDVYLCNAIARILIEEGRVDRSFLDAHVEGYESYRGSVFTVGVGEAAERCGVPEAAIRQAAEWIGKARGFMTLWAMGLNQSAIGVRKNLALMSLNLITGQVGRPGSGPLSLTGQPNAMGGREVGGMSSLLAAHRELSDPRHRKEVADFWGVPEIRERPGYTAIEMFEAMREGRLKSVWIVGTNPMVSLPDLNEAERALERTEFVVVQEISRRSDTLRFADLILPAAGHFEKDGTMTNSERRITHLEKVVDPPGEALPDFEILCRFAREMGFPGFEFRSAAEVFEEHARLTRGTRIDIAGLTHGRLRTLGSVQWPWGEAGPGTAGTDRLFTDGLFFTPNGRARLHALHDAENTSEAVSAELPLTLTTGRIRDQWHTMTKTGKVRRLVQHLDRPFLEIHPDDAGARGVSEGDLVRIGNGRGEVRVRAHLSPDARPGVVFLPMHWGRVGGEAHGRANNLTSRLSDPISRQPDLKFSAVQVTRAAKPRERIVIVGGGAGGYAFVRAYRELNREDDLHVLSAEPHPFYDRVLLPEYAAGTLAWTDLLKYREDELEALNVHLHPSTRARSIDRDRRIVLDEHGGVHPYDRLVFATGSRAAVPPGAPVGEPGVLTMRTREDAEALKASLVSGDRTLVVGGGLLGLELAAVLAGAGIRVTLVQARERLMERQLDPLGSELLQELVEERGITVHLNDRVEDFGWRRRAADRGLRPGPRPPAARELRARLRSGRSVACDAVVFAVGTRPNIELLADAGVACGVGALANDRLQTSDPAIYAIGEIAEHRGTLHGITAAAEEQARVAARHIAGDPLVTYEGTVSVNVLKISGIELCSMGMPSAPPGLRLYDEIVLLDRAERYYKKCVVKEDRLVGAILLGGREEFVEFHELIASGIELSERRAELLRPRGSREPVEGALVCACAQVGTGNLERRIAEGIEDLDSLCRSTGAGISCGSCRAEVRRVLERRALAACA